MSALPRSQLNSHNAGCSFDRCVANNVDENAGRLADLIQKNHIPIVQLRLVNGEPKMELIAADISMEYMSISHVWAGGLGNFKANKLPSCQLARLYRRLNALTRLRPSRPKLENFDVHARHPDWLRLCFRAMQALHVLAMKSAARTKEIITCIHRTCASPSEPEQLPPVYFWMNTLCIPVNPQHRDLRQKAIGNMALTYAAAQRCLVLDPELERIEMKGLTPLQINAHMFGSTWLTRSWTLQEARLSRAWFAQFADGLYNPNSRANGALDFRLYSDWIVNRSDAQELESEMISWYHGMPAVRQTDVIANQSRDLLSDPTNSFMKMWNQLCSRSTSKPEDIHGIMANILDFSAEEVLALPLQDRMKAILRAHGSLPASLIYNNGRKLRDPTCRWVPLYPEQLELNDIGGSLRQTKDGFLLDQTQANPVGFLVDPSLPREAKIRLEYAVDSDPLWITFHLEPDARPVSWAAAVDSVAMCYVVADLSKSLRRRALMRRPRGARFALRRLNGRTLHLVYEYSFLYSVQRRWEDPERDFRTVRAERTGEDAVFHIDCDLSSWPKLSYHRDTSSELTSHGMEFYTLFWLCYCISFWVLFYYLTIFTSPSRPLLLPTIILIIRTIIGIFEILRLRNRVNEHAYKAWVKTFDQSGSLKKRTERTDGVFLEIGTRIKSMGDRMGLVENKGERLDQRLVKGKTLVVMWEKDEGFPFVWSVTTVKVIIIA
ncbi:MAG: hypothetical protein LQ350_006433 [Teloschistes chrysophthalmus]|nr:MAG: hypothetical protein LQ350_006433 [Niorma chrysophthalma]